MGRRGRQKWNSDGRSVIRSTLGDGNLFTAIATIDRLMHRAVTAMTEYLPSREQTIEMLFPASTIAKAAAANGIVDPISQTVTYPVAGDKVWLNIDYTGAYCAPISSRSMDQQIGAIKPLFDFVHSVSEVYIAYNRAKGVLRWLNRNATAGAIRYYWPPAMKLAPHSACWFGLEDVPSRYHEPRDIGDWLQAIRDSSTTLASAAMIPETVQPRIRNNMWLTFHAAVVQSSDPTSTFRYECDSAQFNI
jgi:hypothetical protein